TVGKGLGLLERGLKMIFSRFPPMSRCRGHTRDRMREAENRPKRYRPGADQLTNKRIKLPRLRLLTEHNEALDHEREHPPRTHGVLLAEPRQPRALFIKDCQCAAVIARISHLSEKRSHAESPNEGLYSRAV